MPHYDFWAAVKERRTRLNDEREPFTFTIGDDETIELPPEMPAGFVIEIAALSPEGQDRPLTDVEAVRIASKVITREQLDRILAKGFAVQELPMLITRIMAHYMGVSEESVVAAAEAWALGEGKRRSRSESHRGGRRSKPTSKPTTGST